MLAAEFSASNRCATTVGHFRVILLPPSTELTFLSGRGLTKTVRRTMCAPATRSSIRRAAVGVTWREGRTLRNIYLPWNASRARQRDAERARKFRAEIVRVDLPLLATGLPVRNVVSLPAGPTSRNVSLDRRKEGARSVLCDGPMLTMTTAWVEPVRRRSRSSKLSRFH